MVGCFISTVMVLVHWCDSLSRPGWHVSAVAVFSQHEGSQLFLGSPAPCFGLRTCTLCLLGANWPYVIVSMSISIWKQTGDLPREPMSGIFKGWIILASHLCMAWSEGCRIIFFFNQLLSPYGNIFNLLYYICNVNLTFSVSFYYLSWCILVPDLFSKFYFFLILWWQKIQAVSSHWETFNEPGPVHSPELLCPVLLSPFKPHHHTHPETQYKILACVCQQPLAFTQ